MKINSLLSRLGMDPVDEPPVRPQIAAPAPQSLSITNTGGAIALKLACPTSPGTNTMLWASAPQKSGRRSTPGLVFIGMVPTPVTGSSDVTSLYVARYGVPPVDSRVFVRCNIVQDGWEGGSVQFDQRVPVSS